MIYHLFGCPTTDFHVNFKLPALAEKFCKSLVKRFCSIEQYEQELVSFYIINKTIINKTRQHYFEQPCTSSLSTGRPSRRLIKLYQKLSYLLRLAITIHHSKPIKLISPARRYHKFPFSSIILKYFLFVSFECSIIILVFFLLILLVELLCVTCARKFISNLSGQDQLGQPTQIKPFIIILIIIVILTLLLLLLLLIIIIIINNNNNYY